MHHLSVPAPGNMTVRVTLHTSQGVLHTFRDYRVVGFSANGTVFVFEPAAARALPLAEVLTALEVLGREKLRLKVEMS